MAVALGRSLPSKVVCWCLAVLAHLLPDLSRMAGLVDILISLAALVRPRHNVLASRASMASWWGRAAPPVPRRLRVVRSGGIYVTWRLRVQVGSSSRARRVFVEQNLFCFILDSGSPI